jgi:hypothetical protein
VDRAGVWLEQGCDNMTLKTGDMTNVTHAKIMTVQIEKLNQRGDEE